MGILTAYFFVKDSFPRQVAWTLIETGVSQWERRGGRGQEGEGRGERDADVGALIMAISRRRIPATNKACRERYGVVKAWTPRRLAANAMRGHTPLTTATSKRTPLHVSIEI